MILWNALDYLIFSTVPTWSFAKMMQCTQLTFTDFASFEGWFRAEISFEVALKLGREQLEGVENNRGEKKEAKRKTKYEK